MEPDTRGRTFNIIAIPTVVVIILIRSGVIVIEIVVVVEIGIVIRIVIAIGIVIAIRIDITAQEPRVLIF